MPKASITRSVTFAAAHRYGRSDWSDERNEQVFGLCARDSSHTHAYACDVTIHGEIDSVTGFVVDLDLFDRTLDTEVKQRFDHRNINTDLPEFADGKLSPSGENLARFIFEKMNAALPEGVSVVRVTVAEDPTLSATYEGVI